jgi:hypothetical protein
MHNVFGHPYAVARDKGISVRKEPPMTIYHKTATNRPSLQIRTLTPALKREFLARLLWALQLKLRKGRNVQRSDVMRLLTYCSDSGEPQVIPEQRKTAGAGAECNCTSPGTLHSPLS